MAYAHRGDSNAVEFTYDNLDRLAVAEYNITDESNEVFIIDDLGNRELVNVRDGTNVDYVIDANTNRYTEIDGDSLAYNNAGGLATDKDAYIYEYDYENRITKVLKPGPITVAEYVYDAFGRRIKKTDSIVSSQSKVYYYNDNWQVLCEYGGRGFATMLQWFAYGNYIDEPLIRGKQDDSVPESTGLYFYIHDHLYDTVALVRRNVLSVLERYEYDAYGNCYVLEPDFTADPDGISDYTNPYLYTGRTLDILDNGNLRIQDNRNRYYDTYTGRFLTHDPLGITPNPQWPNTFDPIGQYKDGSNIYEYGKTNPLTRSDPMGLAFILPIPVAFAGVDCGVCSLYQSRDPDTPLRIMEIQKKGLSYAMWGYSIESLSMGRIAKKMCNHCCGCFSLVRILDHGRRDILPDGTIMGMQRYGWEPAGGKHYLDADDVRSICPLLCQNATLKLMGCDVGQGSRIHFQPLFNACPRMAKIIACTAFVYYPSGNCEGTWKTFQR